MSGEEKVKAGERTEDESLEESPDVAPMEEETAVEEKTDETPPDEESIEGEGFEPVTEEEAVEKPVAVAEEPEVDKGPSGAEKVAAFVAKFHRDNHPNFKPGDTIRVHYKIIEGNKERIQVFEGVVISLKHSGLDKTFTVRKVTWGVGVERTFFYHSRKIDKLKVVRSGRVRRAKIYYLRKRVGRAARIKELRKTKEVSNSK